MIYVGTAGYSYRDWIGHVYPQGIKNEDMLAHYAKIFCFTEINSTYYRIPSPYMTFNMQNKTPRNFLFSVKAFKGITHSRDASTGDYMKFLEALKPIAEAGKLACVLAQFPYSFRNNRKNKDYLKFIRERLKDIPLAVEFRNQDWIVDDTIKLLKEMNSAFVCVDMPFIKGLPRPVVALTGTFGYVRFHGRNADKWYHHEKAYERYDYLYTKKELEKWVPAIFKLSGETDSVYISFNNHFQGKAVNNALLMQELLKNRNF